MDVGRLNRAMNVSVAEGALATAMGTLAGGVFLTGFALEMGASRLQIGILAALPVLGNLAQLWGASIIAHTGACKPLCMITSLASRLLWLPILIMPLLLPRDGTGVWWIIAVFGLLSALASLGGVGWLVWIKELIPAPRRVEFFGRRNFYNSALSLALGMASAVCLDWSRAEDVHSLVGFIGVFFVAMACGLVGWALLNTIPAPPRALPDRTSVFQQFTGPLKDQNFRSLVSFYAVWNLSVHLAQPFFAVYMLQKMHLSFACVTGLATLSSLLGLLANGFWTRLSAQYGTRPVVLVATLCDVCVPLCWLFASPGWWPLLIGIHCFGLINAPLTMGPNNFLMRLAPAKNSAPYLALFNSLIGSVSATAAICGGAIATVLLNWNWSVGPIEIGGLKVVFLLSALGRLASIAMLLRVREPESAPVLQVVGAFRDQARRLPLLRRPTPAAAVTRKAA